MSTMQGPRLLLPRPLGDGGAPGWPGTAPALALEAPTTVAPTALAMAQGATVPPVTARARHRAGTTLDGTPARDLFMTKWYCNPGRPMSQSGRLPS